MNERNICKLVGNVTDNFDGGFTLETTIQNFVGDKFSEKHPVKGESQKIGAKLAVIGHFETIDRKTWIIADKITPVKKGALGINLAHIIGKAARAFKFFPKLDQKSAFGNVLLMTGDGQFHRGIIFGSAAYLLSRKCTKGSEVSLQGRIQHRPYEDNDGNMQYMLEIVGDEDETTVLKSAKRVDQFVDDLPDEMPEGAVI